MSGDQVDPTELIGQLSAESLASFPGAIFDLIAEDLVFVAWDGHLYVGHEGMAVWFDQQLREWANIGFEQKSSEGIGEGWVYTVGDVLFEDRRGQVKRQPGHWLAHVRGGKVAAVLYCRTRADASRVRSLDGVAAADGAG